MRTKIYLRWCLYSILFSAIYFQFFIDAHAAQYASITIEPTPATQMRSDSHVIVDVFLQNTAGHVLQIKDGPARGLYIVDVRDRAGTEAKLTMTGKNLYGGADVFSEGHFTTLWLRPGQVVREEINVGEIYDLTQPGTYTIQLSRRFDDGSGPRYIRSKPISVTVRQ